MQVKGKKYQMEKNGKTSTIIKNIILVFATITFIAVLILNFIYNANTDKLSAVEIEYVKIINLIISIFIANLMVFFHFLLTTLCCSFLLFFLFVLLHLLHLNFLLKNNLEKIGTINFFDIYISE